MLGADLESPKKFFLKDSENATCESFDYIDRAVAEIQKKNLNGARTLFQKAISFSNQNDRVWLGLALVYREFGDRELALANTLMALDINLDNDTALRLFVDISRSLGRSESALAHIRKLRELNGKHQSLPKKISEINV